MDLRLIHALAGTALLAAVALLPSSADAYGGTFGDVTPDLTPVSQTAADVLHVRGDGWVETHIQIRYDATTGANAFGWVIPVPSTPTFSVGSQLFLESLVDGTAPNYGLTTDTASCSSDNTNADDDEDSIGTSEDEDELSDDDGAPPDPAQVVYRATVGAYEVVVLEATDADDLETWLTDNGYQPDENARPILEQYIAEGYQFAAAKLTHSVTTSQVHPLVMRIENPPEVRAPIRLTSIAALEDMDVRLFFLDAARVSPVNYRHVLVNPLKIDWFKNGSNYDDVVSVAVDSAAADGNAFVTEYALPLSVNAPVFTNEYYWFSLSDDLANLGASPVGLYEALEAEGLLVCAAEVSPNTCFYQHPLLRGILEEFAPPPPDVVDVDFYPNIADYDVPEWDAAGFQAAFQTLLLDPATHAQQLLNDDTYNYLTRIYTRISPIEMSIDPLFRANTSLPNVPQGSADLINNCDGSASLHLPDGREVVFPSHDPNQWPDFSDTLPWVEDVDTEDVASDLPLINLVDNTSEIDEILDDWNNKARAQVTPPATGCGCTLAPAQGGALSLLGLLGLLGLVRRRRP